MRDVSLTFDREPSALRFMALAFAPKRRGALVFPACRARWSNLRPSGRVKTVAGAPVLHPVHLHAATMRLQMALLTHPRFPLPIWRMLQVRNHVESRRPCAPRETLEVTLTLGETRVLERGVELDLHVRTAAANDVVLDAVSTYYLRGRFDGASAAEPPPSPEPPRDVRASLTIERAGALRYGQLTGDYNGLHWSPRYARAFGFPLDFAHPHRALAEVLDRLDGVDLTRPFAVEIWFKGPVPYGRLCDVASARTDGVETFALRLRGDERAAIVGVARSA